jgi:hypothetical protein
MDELQASIHFCKENDGKTIFLIEGPRIATFRHEMKFCNQDCFSEKNVFTVTGGIIYLFIIYLLLFIILSRTGSVLLQQDAANNFN